MLVKLRKSRQAKSGWIESLMATACISSPKELMENKKLSPPYFKQKPWYYNLTILDLVQRPWPRGEKEKLHKEMMVENNASGVLTVPLFLPSGKDPRWHAHGPWGPDTKSLPVPEPLGQPQNRNNHLELCRQFWEGCFHEYFVGGAPWRCAGHNLHKWAIPCIRCQNQPIRSKLSFGCCHKPWIHLSFMGQKQRKCGQVHLDDL